MAVEDIGLAEPNALALCMAARDAVDFIGMPEGNLALAQAVVYLSVAPKSNALYAAYSNVQQDVEQTAAEPVPLHLRNAPTRLMKNIGYGKDYQYAHELENKVADMQCLPDNLRDREYYVPTREGVERRIGERLEEIKRLRQEAQRRQCAAAESPEKRVLRGLALISYAGISYSVCNSLPALRVHAMATSTGPIVHPGTDMIGGLPTDRVQELLKLQKAAQKISSILDLDQLIDKIVNDIACSFGCVEISVFLHEAERSELVLAGVHGCSVHHKGHRLKVGKEGLVGYVAATGQMRYAPDVALDPYYIACEQETRSEVAIPLHVDGQLVGVFTASHREPDAFDADQLWLFQGLCVHIAVAVQNARRFQHERSEREKMSREAQEARSIQQALLPKSSPFIPGFAVSGLSISAGAVRRRLV